MSLIVESSQQFRTHRGQIGGDAALRICRIADEVALRTTVLGADPNMTKAYAQITCDARKMSRLQLGNEVEMKVDLGVVVARPRVSGEIQAMQQSETFQIFDCLRNCGLPIRMCRRIRYDVDRTARRPNPDVDQVLRVVFGNELPCVIGDLRRGRGGWLRE